jgi:hypothetical protein
MIAGPDVGIRNQPETRLPGWDPNSAVLERHRGDGSEDVPVWAPTNDIHAVPDPAAWRGHGAAAGGSARLDAERAHVCVRQVAVGRARLATLRTTIMHADRLAPKALPRLSPTVSGTRLVPKRVRRLEGF